MIQMKDKYRTIVLLLSFIIAALIFLTSFVGLFLPGFYEIETEEWQAQCRSQDFINLVIIVPSFLITSLFSFYKKLYAHLVWAGCLLYIVYTYLIYCFDIHFNIFFILYCVVLSLSVYLLFYFFYSYKTRHITSTVSSKIVKTTAIYFLILPVAFYIFWLSEIIPATINFTLPASVGKSGLFTNPVHVLDLSFLLPGIFITGIMLLQKKRLAFALTSVLLTFFILMDITIMALTLFMIWRGMITNYGIVCMMASLAAFSFVLLLYHLRTKQ